MLSKNEKLIILFILISGVLSFKQAQAELLFWCTGDSQKVKPYENIEEKNFFWDGKGKTVKLYSAKNEYAAFQIVIKAKDEKLSGVNVAAEDFKNKEETISRDNIELFREHYLKVTIPSSIDGKPVEDVQVGEYSTQMVPFYAPKGGAPFDIEKNRNQPVWVDVYIPEDTKPGDYESIFTISINNKEPIKIKVLLKVWDFVLPHQTHLRTYIYYGSEQLRWAFGYNDSSHHNFRKLEDKFFQMARQHRLNLCPNIEIDWGWDEQRLEKYWHERGRGIYIDGSAYTAGVGKGMPANTWIVQIDDFDHKAEYQRLASEVVKFFRKKGLEDILILYVYDEPRSKENYEFIRERCQWVHEALGKELPCMVTAPISTPNLFWGSLVGYVDIWNSGASSLKDIKKRQRAGDRVWTYNMGWGGGPYLDTPGISGRTQGWAAWKFGFEGWMFWDSCYWIDTGNLRDKSGKRMSFEEINANPEKYATDIWKNPMTFDQMKRPGYLEGDAIRLNGDGVLFYPGTEVGLEEPISSFVMKSLRRGLQDYEYLWLLKNMGREQQIKPIVDSLMPESKKWNKDVNVWYEARIKLAKEILRNQNQPID